MANPAHVTAQFRCELPAARLPSHFGIVTAFNPGDQRAPPEANAHADQRLLKQLKQQGWLHFRVTGGNAGFIHAEPGWRIAATEDELLAVGRDFGQAAIYWIDQGELWLCACDGSERLPLGSWASRTLFPPA